MNIKVGDIVVATERWKFLPYITPGLKYIVLDVDPRDHNSIKVLLDDGVSVVYLLVRIDSHAWFEKVE